MTSDVGLKRLYDKFNREFFGGELTDDITIYWEACAAHGETFLIDVVGGEQTIGIRINPQCHTSWKGSRQGWVKLTLLHEMCHVKLFPHRGLRTHGKLFKAEIARLCTFPKFRDLL